MTISISQVALWPFVIWLAASLVTVGINITFLVIVLRLWRKLEKSLLASNNPPTFWHGDDYDDYLWDGEEPEDDEYDDGEDEEEDANEVYVL